MTFCGYIFPARVRSFFIPVNSLLKSEWQCNRTGPALPLSAGSCASPATHPPSGPKYTRIHYYYVVYKGQPLDGSGHFPALLHHLRLSCLHRHGIPIYEDYDHL